MMRRSKPEVLLPFTLSLGAAAPDFNLPGTDGRNHSLADYASARLLVICFSCNHCPYVVGSEQRMINFVRDYSTRGVQFIAINSNETQGHPGDSFENMIVRAKEKDFQFSYLRDDDQSVAVKYGALRTPHYYVFDTDRKLRYGGRMDDRPRHPGTETTHELRDAVDDLLAGKQVHVPLTNPIGCNVKWIGKERHWMPAEACDLV